MDTLLDHQISGNELSCLLLPIADSQLLLPTFTVAEMIPYRPLQPKAGREMAEWFLGNLPWRGLAVPILSFEKITGHELPPVNVNSQISIFNNTGVNERLPFLGIPTTGIPHLSRITREGIHVAVNVDLKPYEIMHVDIADGEAVIPDVSALEHACADLLGL